MMLEKGRAQDTFDRSDYELGIGLLPHEQQEKSRKRAIAAILIGLLVIAAVVAVIITASAGSSSAVASESEEEEDTEIDYANDPSYAEGILINDGVSYCNDGTPGLYYFRDSPTGEHADRWIIRFKGPSFCTTSDECSYRSANMHRQMTSDGMPEWDLIDFALPAGGEGDPGGILLADETNNPYFWDDNHIQAHYCSSDLWTGDSEELMFPDIITQMPEGIYFRGRTIARSIIKELTDVHGMREKCSRAVFIYEGMATAGAFTNADWIYDWFAENIPQCKVYVVLDAGWSPDYPCFDEPYTGFVPWPTLMSAGYDVWGGENGGSNIVDPDCVAAGLTWECFVAGSALDFMPEKLNVGTWQNLFAYRMLTQQYGITETWFWDGYTNDYILGWAEQLQAEMQGTKRYAALQAGDNNDAFWVSMCQNDDDFSTYAMSRTWMDLYDTEFTPEMGLYNWMHGDPAVCMAYHDCGWVPNCEADGGCDYRPFDTDEAVMPIPDPYDHNDVCDAAPLAKKPKLA